MPTSINGWPVLDSPPWDDDRLVRMPVPGTPCVVYARKAVAPLLVALALDYHKTIHPLTEKSDVDCYDYRQARAANAWSDHSSGTAMDLRASHEGAQGRSTYRWWEGEKAAAARALKAKYEIFIWGAAKDLGGDYSNPRYWDPMHWALKPGTTPNDVARIMQKLNIGGNGLPVGQPMPAKPTVASSSAGGRSIIRVADVQPGKSGLAVSLLQAALAKAGFKPGPLDGEFGPKTQAAYAAFQRSLGYSGADADGAPGIKSLKALGALVGFNVAS